MARKKRTKKFIQKAIKRPGSLTRMAKRAGKSITAYCRTVLSKPRKGRNKRAWYKCHFYMNVLKKVGGRKKKK